VVGTIDDQLALRVGAFRLARRRGRIGEAAWAASRLRLAGVQLEQADVRFGRAVRVRLGHALRVARLRAAYSERPEVSVPVQQLRRRSLWRPLLAGEAAALLLVVALLWSIPTPTAAGGEPESAPSAQAATIETQPPPLRGRTQPGQVVPVAYVAATPVAVPAPAPATPASGGAGAAGGGSGAGGSGGGSGNGNVAPTPTQAPAATPAPPPPPPFIDPRNLVHVLGRVVDSRTRQGIANVCISYGTLDCSMASRTDTNGNFDIPLDGRSSWIFRFIHPGYTTASLNNVRLRPGPPINVGTIQLRRAP
jgi:hypothetical protein